jgi:hypothetical protein
MSLRVHAGLHPDTFLLWRLSAPAEMKPGLSFHHDNWTGQSIVTVSVTVSIFIVLDLDNGFLIRNLRLTLHRDTTV